MDEDRTLDDESSYRLSVAGGVVALLGAVALAFLFYFVVGYPLNVPLALGSSVLLVEIVEAVVRQGRRISDVAGTAVLHSFLAAGAAWLGAVLGGVIA